MIQHRKLFLDSEELDFSQQDFAAEELSSIIDPVPKLYLESKENFQILYQ